MRGQCSLVAFDQIGVSSDVGPAESYPTDSKERDKQNDADNQLRGIDKVAKMKPKVVERHYDDCGNDLGGLGDAFA